MIKTSIALILCFNIATAQGCGTSIKSTWSNTTLLILNPENKEIFESITPGKNIDTSKKHALNLNNSLVALKDGSIYKMEIKKGQPHPIYRIHPSRPNELVGFLDHPKGTPLHFQVISEDRIITVTSNTPYIKNNQASPVGVYRQDSQGIFKFEKLIPINLPSGRPIFKKIAVNGPKIDPNDPSLWTKEQGTSAFLAQMFLFSKAPFISIKDITIMISHRTGHIWKINTKGDILSQIAFYPEYDDNKIKETLNYKPVILGAAPTQDDCIIFATRSPKGVFGIDESLKFVDKTGKIIHDNLISRPLLSPDSLDIEWHELSLKEASDKLIKTEIQPPNAPITLESFEHDWYQNDSIPFVITWDNRFKAINARP